MLCFQRPHVVVDIKGEKTNRDQKHCNVRVLVALPTEANELDEDVNSVREEAEKGHFEVIDDPVLILQKCVQECQCMLRDLSLDLRERKYLFLVRKVGFAQ